MAIVKYRLDSRMLHGQTCAAWGATLHIDEYIVVNEKTANDPMQVTLLQLAAMGKEVAIVSPVDAKQIFDDNDFLGDRTMVIFKDILDAVEIVKLGYHIDELSIGGMFDEAGRERKKYEACLFVSEKDKEAFRYLESQGVKLVLQIVPDYKEKLVKDLVKF